MSIAIKVESLSKAYQLGEFSTGTISQDIERWWLLMRGKEDPFLKIGESNDRTVKGTSDIVWSLKDINFEISQGDAVGIIGRNGAGKSTLLKVLSRVTSPSTGSVKVKGRISSLLEVGTGFHPELTGRENIYLNGAILGMRTHEIKKHFDAIVDFSGVERYIDTPVKRYSSGMYVRLAFAVAAHLESEILIVDEVLAVGDAEFQKKCLGKMGDVSRSEGRTILFVSHNIAAVNSLCNKAVVMANGNVVFKGDVRSGINYYINTNSKEGSAFYINSTPNEIDIVSIKVLNQEGKAVSNHNYSSDINLEIKIKTTTECKNGVVDFRVRDQKERNVFTTSFSLNSLPDLNGEYTLNAIIPGGVLVPNIYTPIFAIHIPNKKLFTYLEDCLKFEIEETGSFFEQFSGVDYGCVFVNCKWSLYTNSDKVKTEVKSLSKE